ncbi:MAG: hypothetical protein HY897_17805 [Deltaproteobacteria bacterium]|nr:hypothetical protein [Deltaproteobacteria bacterium]
MTATKFAAGLLAGACIACAFAAAARAGTALPDEYSPDDLIRDAVGAYDAMEYDRAVPILQEAFKLPGLSQKQRITVLQYGALICIIQKKDPLARETIREIYRLKPDFELPQTMAPSFRKFFEDVRNENKPKPAPAPVPVPEPEHRPTPRVIEPWAVPPPPPANARAADPVDADDDKPPPDGARPGVGRKVEGPNWFVRFWPSWTCFIAGAALLTPGILVGLDADSGRGDLEAAERDSQGRITSLSYEQARALQDEADRKGLTATALMGAGAAAMVTGAIMFFVYDGASPPSKPDLSLSPATDGRSILVTLGGGF